MKRAGLHATFAVLAVGMAACGHGSPADQSLAGGDLAGTVLITTDKSSYQNGALVELTIHNGETERVSYNACTRGLEVNENGTWVPGPESLRLCTREVWYVEANATRLDSTDLDLGLTPGDYRMVISFGRGYAPDGEVIRAVSNSFTITP
jgi:hypothetical protein